ncbi:hypothetical protein Q9R20_12980 [Microbacterium sp. PRF11]|uniref:hypothetical protein n=1 Tax=Microbacterium sp. PRF11 TaxID=2962593 RepID=UPI002882341B|nr:hypothetical protein [Microbacterium sp. PRF11]MDT0117901.1 hypothetical protein [Microbacterium sp. PRF11]
MHTTRTSFAVLAASALLLLAGCSGGTTAPADTASESAAATPAATAAATSAAAAATTGQSKADACQIIISSFTDVTQASSEISTSDPQAAVATFRTLADKVTADFAQISNAEIAPVAQKASAQLGEYVTFLDSVVSDPSKVSGLSDQVTALQESFTEAGTACQG